MKFIVDKLPKDPYECNFAEWVPFPPIIEKSGEYRCKITNKKCNLTYDSTECEGLKVNE